MFFNKTKQDKMQILQGILFFKGTSQSRAHIRLEDPIGAELFVVRGFEDDDSLKDLHSDLFCLIIKRYA